MSKNKLSAFKETAKKESEANKDLQKRYEYFLEVVGNTTEKFPEYSYLIFHWVSSYTTKTVSYHSETHVKMVISTQEKPVLLPVELLNYDPITIAQWVRKQILNDAYTQKLEEFTKSISTIDNEITKLERELKTKQEKADRISEAKNRMQTKISKQKQIHAKRQAHRTSKRAAKEVTTT